MTLLTEQNTRRVERLVLRAAKRRFHRRYIDATFEHGQWWVTIMATGAQYSVCDSTDPGGFEFEEVTRGDE